MLGRGKRASRCWLAVVVVILISGGALSSQGAGRGERPAGPGGDGLMIPLDGGGGLRVRQGGGLGRGVR